MKRTLIFFLLPLFAAPIALAQELDCRVTESNDKKAKDLIIRLSDLDSSTPRMHPQKEFGFAAPMRKISEDDRWLVMMQETGSSFDRFYLDKKTGQFLRVEGGMDELGDFAYNSRGVCE